MPYCSTCSMRFKGRGTHCAMHNPYFFSTRSRDPYTSSGDTMDVYNIRYRTGHGNTHRAGYRHRPRALEYHDTYENGHYNSNHNTSLVPTRYDLTNHLTNHLSNNIDPTISSPTNIRTVASAFNVLTHSHAISSLTYSVAPNGAQSVTAEANLDREQCPVCRMWFPDIQHLERHQWEFPVGCEAHGVCLRDEDSCFHGTSERHDRCFVRGCSSVYRREGGWKTSVIENHVLEWHP